jgi:membrane-bound lytic murein transglycosylase A
MSRCRGVPLLAGAVVGLFAWSCPLLAARVAPWNPITLVDTQYEPVDWRGLEGWSDDNHAAAFVAFLESCRARTADRRRKRQPISPFAATIGRALKPICARALAAAPLGEAAARKFFERNFTPLRINRLGERQGFLTGYYEPVLEGSRVRTDEFTAPVYRQPPDLVLAGAHNPGEDFPSKGVKIGRRVGNEGIAPYYDRAEIEDGALTGDHLEICWLRSETDVLFAQIQGSARVKLRDGTLLRLHYASYNGWPYTPVGRVLIDRNIIPKDEMSMQRIRDWMEANPDAAKDVRRQNKSYVFFRIADLAAKDEPIGDAGVPLTPGRSIAVDRSLHAYGTPFFISADLPSADDKGATRFRRLVIAQDTGSAIVGPARADIYFGSGEAAARIAGRVRNPGDFVILLPRALDPARAARRAPLPPLLPRQAKGQ